MANEKQTCEDLVSGQLERRLDDIRGMWEAYQAGDEDGPEDTGSINDYGLSFEYVIPERVRETPNSRGYWRWLISWGGPSEEFRFYGEAVSEYRATLDRIEFRYHDWFDGAGRDVAITSDDGKLLGEWFDNLAECGTLAHVRDKAIDVDD